MFKPNSDIRHADEGSSWTDRHEGGERVAIIGCGATGAYALHFLLRVPQVREIVAFESSDLAGPGLPYHPQYNDPQALSNIAGVEIPPLVEGVNEWATRQTDSKLREWGIEDSAGDERAFFPRIVLGAWLSDQFKMLALDGNCGKRIEVRTKTEVKDIIALPGACKVKSLGRDGPLREELFDRVIVATGYGSNACSLAGSEHDPELMTGKAFSTTKAARTAILGTSLSAIDAVVSIAIARGAFVEEEGELRYRPDDSWQATMMSRGGILPEADFWFPQPSPPPAFFTHEAAEALVNGRDGDLDRLFDLFKKEITFHDPDYARRTDLANASVDDFAARYFDPRSSGDPFVHARANLAEAAASHAAGQTILWRHAILEAHEVFGAILPRLSTADFERFHRGLKRVFTDNYAAVPHLSIMRLLALHEAGVLRVVKLGKDYRVEPMQNGGWSVSAADFHDCFDALVDARGQQTAPIDTLLFPTLRLQICAAANAEGDRWENGINPDCDFTLSPRDPAWRRVHLCALPYLLRERPFTQGLIECARMAQAVANAVAQDGPADTVEAELEPMIEHLETGSTVVLGDGSVLSL